MTQGNQAFLFFKHKLGMLALLKSGKTLTSEGHHTRAPTRPFSHASKYTLSTAKRRGQ